MPDNIYTGLFAIAYTLIGAIVGHWFSKKASAEAMRLQLFYSAAAALRAAFVEEIRFIDRFYVVDRAGKDIPEILSAATNKHELAFITFKNSGFLCESQRTGVDKAWKDYTGDDQYLGKYTFKQYTTYGKFKDAESIRNLAIDRIEKILSFAEFKH